MIPQAMALISIARLTVGGLFFRLYLKYLGVSERNARFVSIAYAFTGCRSIQNVILPSNTNFDRTSFETSTSISQ